MTHPLLEQIGDKAFSVTEYLDLVNELLGPLKVFVEGEITDLKILPQWVFFSLKDAESGAVLRCGLHSGVYRKLGVNVEEGMRVKIEGYGKISPKTGNFGFWVSSIEPVGEGALRRAYELLVEKLKTEGLFERKRELPEFISHIGVISSRNGVVTQDLMENLAPLGIRVDFTHSGVEGADSAKEIEKCIRFFSTKEDAPQVLILIRGGGSLESLQGFNNEAVVRALYATPMPVLVGIGHDVDAPIATMVADWSASTPTAVAHVINESWAPLTKKMPEYVHTITRRFSKKLQTVEHRAEATLQSIQFALRRLFVHFTAYEESLRVARRTLARLIVRKKEQGFELLEKCHAKLQHAIQGSGQKVLQYERVLSLSDPRRILKRGYGLVYTNKGVLVRSVKDVEVGEELRTQLGDGTIFTKVTEKEY